jgi:proline dehydrogenase
LPNALSGLAATGHSPPFVESVLLNVVPFTSPRTRPGAPDRRRQSSMMRDTVQKNFYFLARRFVAGDNIGDAIAAVRALNAEGMSATLDFLGEDVHVADAARRTREVYEEMLDAIAQSGVDSNVSVKLTAMGLLFDEKFALDNLVAILERAARNSDPFVRIDMEGSAVVEATLGVFQQAFAAHRNVGPVLQSYLKRTPADVDGSSRAHTTRVPRSPTSRCRRSARNTWSRRGGSCCMETIRASQRTIAV